MKLSIALGLVAVLAGAALVTRSYAQDKKPAPAAKEEKSDKGADAAIIAAQMPLYPMTTCVMSGKPLGADAVNVVKDGQLVRFCCSKCAASFEKDSAATMKKVQDAVVAAQTKAYPMEKCPISGDALGKDAVNVVHGSMLVRLCCNKCVEKFNKEPDTFIKKVDEAYMASQRASYPLKTCIVMTDEKLDDNAKDKPVEILYGTKLVRFCCKKCVAKFQASPEKYLAALDKKK